MLSHCFLEKFQGGLLIARLRHEAFQYLTFVIHSPPQVVPFTVDLHEHLIQMPASAAGFHTLDPALLYLGSEHRAAPMPPEPHSLVTDVDAALVQQILDVPQRKRKPDIHHHGKADDLGAGTKVPKGAAFCHPQMLGNRPCRLKTTSL